MNDRAWQVGRVGVGRVALVATALWVCACSDSVGPSTGPLSIDPPPSDEVVVGDVLTLTARGPAAVTWSTSDEAVAGVVAGQVEARRPGSVTISVAAPGSVSAEVALIVVARPGGYTAAEIDYFAEIAFGSEFGSATPSLRRWRTGSGPLMRINGSPTSEDRVVLDSVIAEINRLAPVDMEVVADFPTAEVHFVPEDEFQSVLPQAPTGNIGLVWLFWGADDFLTNAVVLIATEPAQSARNHILREEVTQMLGLLQDSYRYPQSIFYQAYSEVSTYQPIDRAVIEILYRPELRPGMTVSEAQRVARTLVRVTPATAALTDRAARDVRAAPGAGARPAGEGGSNSTRPARWISSPPTTGPRRR